MVFCPGPYSLCQVDPNCVYAEFVKGKFVVKKSKRSFSAIAIDQAHEQNNAVVKGDGGAIGLTENSAAFHRWMVSGSEMARLIGEFQTSAEKKHNTETCHHEQKQHIQSAFARDVQSLTEVFEEMGNPFLEDSEDLLVLDSRNIVHVAVSDAIKEIEQLGIDQYEAYVEERLVKQTKAIADPIKRNNLHLFSRPPVQRKSSKQLQLSSLKNDCSLFSRLYIASQHGMEIWMISSVMKTRYVHQYCQRMVSYEMGTNQSCCTAWKSLFQYLCLVLQWKSSSLTVLLLLTC